MQIVQNGTVDLEAIHPYDEEPFKVLRQRFDDREIQWRLNWPPRCIKEEYFDVLPYVSSRAVITRLNQAFGLNWELEFDEPASVGGLLCTIRVFLSDGRVIERSDVGTETQIERDKGAHSDALKRAARMFDCGWYLRLFPDVYVKCPYSTTTDDRGRQRKKPRYIPSRAGHQLNDLVHKVHQGAQSLPRYDDLIVVNYTPIVEFVQQKGSGNDDDQQWPPPGVVMRGNGHNNPTEQASANGQNPSDDDQESEDSKQTNRRGFTAYGKEWPPRSEWDGHTLAEYLRSKANDLDNSDTPVAPGKDFESLRGGARSAIMSVVKCGDAAKEDARYRMINQFVFDKYSSEQWSRGEAVTIIAWVDSTKDEETGEYIPSEMALREAPMLWRAYEKQQGQQELFEVDEPERTYTKTRTDAMLERELEDKVPRPTDETLNPDRA